MDTPANVVLLKLSDTELTLANADEDIRHRKVIDSDGQEIGTIDELIIDDHQKKVRFLRVAAGGFLGLGAQKFLIPIDAVARIDKQSVQINRTREHVAAAPAYSPELVPDQSHIDRLYGYWGFPPFWIAGYTYPGFPYYL
jgi:sporulation protein YlmC with PRC-barrel domain